MLATVASQCHRTRRRQRPTIVPRTVPPSENSPQTLGTGPGRVPGPPPRGDSSPDPRFPERTGEERVPRDTGPRGDAGWRKRVKYPLPRRPETTDPVLTYPETHDPTGAERGSRRYSLTTNVVC